MARSDHHNIVTMVTCLPTLKSNKTLNKLKHLFWTSTWQFVPGIHWLSLELWSMVHCTKLEPPTLRPHDEDQLQVVSLVMVGSGDKLDLWELNWYWSMWISLCRNCFNFDGNSNSMSSRISNNFITDLFLHCILSEKCSSSCMGLFEFSCTNFEFDSITKYKIRYHQMYHYIREFI